MATWRKLYPKASTYLKDLPTLHQDNFAIMQSAANFEHSGLLSATSGTHIPGLVGAVYEGSTVSITGLTANAGALAYDTTIGVLKYYTTGWVQPPSASWSTVRAYLATPASGITVTAGATAETLVFDTEQWDYLSEYDNGTGIFTALASGYYLINANVCFVASGAQEVSAVKYPTWDTGSPQWTTSGAADNHSAVDDPIGTPASSVDADSNYTQTLSAYDVFSGTATLTNPPCGSTDINVKLTSRFMRSGCVCNNACYNEEFECSWYEWGCSTCYATCYLYDAGSCTLYSYCPKQGCICQGNCTGYSGCVSCDSACYSETCSLCYPTTYSVEECECDASQHGSEDPGYIKISQFLYKGGTFWYGDQHYLTSGSFSDIEDQWLNDPETSTPWAASAISAITRWGYRVRWLSSGLHTPWAWVSQQYINYDWWPKRPLAQIHLFVDNALEETTSVPLFESASASTYQVVSLRTTRLLSAGAEVEIRYQKTILDDTISAGSTVTNLSIVRLPGPLL